MVLHFTRHIKDHFGDEPFLATDCTGTDNWKQRNRTTHAPKTQKNKCKKIVLAKKKQKTTKPWLTGLVDFYDMQLENGTGLFL